MNKDRTQNYSEEDLPMTICGISGRPVSIAEAIWQRGMWVRPEYADVEDEDKIPKEEF